MRAAATVIAMLFVGMQAPPEPTCLAVVLASGRVMPLAVERQGLWLPAELTDSPSWRVATDIPRRHPADGNDFANVAIAGPGYVRGADLLDHTSSDWVAIWPAIRTRAAVEEESAIEKVTARHSRSATERRDTAPEEVHLQRARRRIGGNTWYHFVAHKFYGVDDPATDILGIVVRDRRGVVSIVQLTAWAWLSYHIEPELLATIESPGGTVWLMQSVVEEGRDYFLFEPVTGTTILRRVPDQ
jgi:hypothetical protein